MGNSSLNQFARESGIFLIASILTYLFMFFFKFIAARYFGPHIFGVYEMSNTFLQLFVIISLFGFQKSFLRYVSFYAKKKETKNLNSFVKAGFLIPGCISIFFSILLFLFSSKITSFFGFTDLLTDSLRLISLVIFFKTILELIEAYLLSINKTEKSGFLRILESVFLFSAALFSFLLKGNLVFFLVIILCLYFVLIIISILFTKKHIKFEKGIKYKKEWISFSAYTMFAGALAYALGWSDNFFIGAFLTEYELGIYGITYSLASTFLFFKISFDSIFTPMIAGMRAKKDKKGISDIFEKATSWIYILTIPFFFATVLFSKQILSILYGAEFNEGFTSLIILVIGFLIASVTGLSSSILLVFDKTKYILKIQLFVFLINIILNLVLIPILGIEGAAIASALSLVMMQVVFITKANKITKISYKYPIFIKSTLASLISVGVVFSLLRIFVGIFTIETSIVALICYFLLYSFLLFVLRIFDKEDLKIMLLIEKKTGVNLNFIKKILKKIS